MQRHDKLDALALRVGGAVLDVAAESALARVEIDGGDLRTVANQRHGDVHGGRRFARAAFFVADHQHMRPARRARRLGLDDRGIRRWPEVAQASLRIQTAVSWNTAPPLGQPGSAEVTALMPMPVSKLRLGQMPSTTTTPRCWPLLALVCTIVLPRSLPTSTLSPSTTPIAAQSSGFIIAVGRTSRFWLDGVSVKVEFRKVRAGAATRRNGLSSVALSITSKWSGSTGISWPRGPAAFQSGLKRNFLSGQAKPSRKCDVSKPR